MRQKFFRFLAIFIIVLPLGLLVATADELPPEVQSLPATVQCEMLSNLLSERSEIGDKVEVKLVEPINLKNERVFVPVGAIISGQVEEVQEAGRGLKRGKVKVSFNRVYYPNGFSLATDGYLMGNQKTLIEEKDREVGGKSSWKQRFWQAGRVGVGALLGGPVGAGVAAGTLVFDKGGKVRIKAGEAVAVHIAKLSPSTDLDVQGKVSETSKVEEEKVPEIYSPNFPGLNEQ